MSPQSFKERQGYEIGAWWVPRVTAITSVVSKPALARYYEEYLTLEEALDGLSHSADWGTLVHSTIQGVLCGNRQTVDASIAPSVRAFLDWKKGREFQLLEGPEGVERRVLDKDHKYAGTIDLVVMYEGKKGIVDIKTGSSLWDEYALQTAAYCNAYNKSVGATLFERGDARCQTRWILRIDQYEECRGCLAKRRIKEGRPKVRGGKRTCNHQWSPPTGVVEFCELHNQREDFEAFLAAKELWEWYYKRTLAKISNYAKAS